MPFKGEMWCWIKCGNQVISLAERDSISQLPLEIDFQRIDHRQGLAPYFRQYLRVIMTAKKPVKSNYASWQDEIFKEDLWQWENNPLYGFCNKNFKSDGSPYNLYTDGLKIYTTIDSRMQQYAEEAVNEHIPQLQQTFFQEKKGRSYAPFSKHVTKEEINASLTRSMRDSDRYRRLKKSGASTEEINRIFDTKTEMQVFHKGMIDTIMSPRIRTYIKHF